jgi:hypothetical protein
VGPWRRGDGNIETDRNLKIIRERVLASPVDFSLQRSSVFRVEEEDKQETSSHIYLLLAGFLFRLSSDPEY